MIAPVDPESASGSGPRASVRWCQGVVATRWCLFGHTRADLDPDLDLDPDPDLVLDLAPVPVPSAQTPPGHRPRRGPWSSSYEEGVQKTGFAGFTGWEEEGILGKATLGARSFRKTPGNRPVGTSEESRKAGEGAGIMDVPAFLRSSEEGKRPGFLRCYRSARYPYEITREYWTRPRVILVILVILFFRSFPPFAKR